MRHGPIFTTFSNVINAEHVTDQSGEPDHSLLRFLGQAYRFSEMVMSNRGKTMAELTFEAGVGGSYFTRIPRLSFLAPDVVKTILRDRHPLELTAKKLASDTRLPVAWEERIDGRV